MSTTAYTWTKTPPPKPSVYLTRRNGSKYTSARYWDGERWWEIACSNSRGGRPWKWPKGSVVKRPPWIRHLEDKGGVLGLRAIRLHQDAIEWGRPYPVFTDTEMLKYLVEVGCLRPDWREDTQRAMREARGSA